MKRIDNITATQGRLKQAYDKGLGKLVQNDISKTVNNIVKDTRINTGVITKFYPYLDKAEVKLSNDKLILCKILHRYGGELIDYYTPTGEEDYCIKLKEPCILPREELNCLIMDGDDEDVVAVAGDGRHGLALALAPFALFGQGRAAHEFGVEDHAVHAVHAFALVDAAIGVNGHRAAALGAGLAGVAVGLALQPEPAEGGGHGDGSAQRKIICLNISFGCFQE